MTDLDIDPDVEATPSPALWAERTGTRAYTGHNTRGAQVRIGDSKEEGVFSPGELLQLALAACSALSADHRLSHALGADFNAVVGVSNEKNQEENRYERLTVEIVTDLSALDEEARAKTLERAEIAIERGCTVGRTLAAGAPHRIVFTDEVAG
ncbi:OsmC family protein [Georgenia yuyongxinii]|uniref:OsmC family peroxiredoxin n=1 Tax=Georgenia yuyongxinii TaxID=2589797 RepID=A0A552WL69_9MICO|nr:OsmC family protein [Georgenia yuyongxinii]TRW43389.1 OsmC family peroxiredoxin [Georgenia yuyongxinii]